MMEPDEFNTNAIGMFRFMVDKLQPLPGSVFKDLVDIIDITYFDLQDKYVRKCKSCGGQLSITFRTGQVKDLLADNTEAGDIRKRIRFNVQGERK